MLATIVVVVLVVVLLMSSGGGGSLSIGDVEKYCKNNNWETNIGTNDEPKADYITCTGEKDDGTVELNYVVLSMPAMEVDEFRQTYSMMTALGGETLIDENDYKKIYYGVYGMNNYIIARGQNLFM